jgi:hypothetical protein
MLEQKQRQLFDYGAIKDEHKEAILEAISLAKEMGHDMYAEFLSKKFEIVPRKQHSINESKLLQILKENNVPFILQGFSLEDDIEYPIVAIVADVRVLDDFFVNKFKNLL